MKILLFPKILIMTIFWPFNEVKAKFKEIRPKTMGQALRIDGITPAQYIFCCHMSKESLLSI